MRACVRLLACALVCAACGEKTPAGAAELPERLRGAFGQNETQAHMPTVGLQVDATTLKLGELTVTITAGHATGPEDYQVGHAEVAWEKAKGGKPPPPCKGTISRQGDTLLVKLTREGTEDACESVLAGEWKAWQLLTAVPESHRGTYGGDARSSDANVGLRIDATGIGFTDGGPRVTIGELVQSSNKPDTLIVRKAKFDDVDCTGQIIKEGETLKLQLKPAEGAPEGAQCPHGSGTRWTVDAKHLPTGTLDNGAVTLRVKDGRIVLEDKQGLRCEQDILRTSARSVTESAYDGIPFPGGHVLVLAPAAPVAGVDGCKKRLLTVAPTICRQLGEGEEECDGEAAAQLVANVEPSCPTAIAVGEGMRGEHKAALLPASAVLLTCFDMTGAFAAK